MTTTLRACGIAGKVVEKIPGIVSTCRECRVWAKGGNATIPSVTLSERFNQHVECDLLFYKQFIIFHLIDRCTRWHAAKIIENKFEEILLDALFTTWIWILGAPEYFYVDGESGLNTQSAKTWIENQGSKFKCRAPEQHARFIERRGASLRACMHISEQQCIKEGIAITIHILLAICTFAGNALTNIGAGTPYNAVLGRQPAMLPPLDNTEVQAAGDSEDGRVEARVRETVITSMVQTTAQQRITRTLRARTSPSTDGKYKPGDLIDYLKHGGKKDVSGWHGPTNVIKDSPAEGQVIIKLAGREYPYRYQDVRHTLLIFLTYLSGIFHTRDEATKTVEQFIQHMAIGTTMMFGLVTDRNGRISTSDASRQQPQLVAALTFVIRNHLMITNALAARLSRGARRLGEVKVGDHSILHWWLPNGTTQAAEFDGTAINLAETIGPDHTRAYSIQVILKDGSSCSIQDAAEELTTPSNEEIGTPSDAASQAGSINHDRMSTIPEGSNEDDEDLWHVLERYFPENTDWNREESTHHPLLAVCQALESEPSSNGLPSDPGDQEHAFHNMTMHLRTHFGAQVEHAYATVEVPCYIAPQHDVLGRPIQEYAHYMAAGISPESYGTYLLVDEEGNSYVDMAYDRNYAKVCGPDAGMQDGDVMVVRTYLGNTKKCVIERDTDVLTAADLREHWQAASAATLEELRNWVKYNTFNRKSRKGVENIMTSKHVAKWKWVDTPEGRKRILRIRMTIRGFQDWFAHLEENYSGTASRQSQRLLCSEAACHPDWDFVTVDVEKAFLQGMTHEEIEASTGEKQRKAYFNLPPGSAALLRKLPGFEDFDERYECLESTKHGTGTKGAPRAFSLKLSGVTQGPIIRMKSLTFDREMEVRHDRGKLVASGTKHVDDIKYGAVPAILWKEIVPALEAVFGELKINKKVFTNTGVRHARQEDGGIITDQDEYISALKPIQHVKMIGQSPDADADDELASLF